MNRLCITCINLSSYASRRPIVFVLLDPRRLFRSDHTMAGNCAVRRLEIHTVLLYWQEDITLKGRSDSSFVHTCTLQGDPLECLWYLITWQ